MVMRRLSFVLISAVCMILVVVSCGREDVKKEPIVYEGPLVEADNVRTLYSDSGLVRVMVQAPKQYQYESGDQEFPEGIYIEFYEPDGAVSSTLTANRGFFFNEESRYTGIGEVKVVSLKDNNRLLTDTLHYGTKEPFDRQIYTKDRVTIVEGQDTLRGNGLESARDFSSYTILNPEGSTIFEEEQEEEAEKNENN